ncbi:hypothetical protein Ccrd_015099 [Cynara cardunculus var. scolymus]|uniref:Uncharacterized protein n=1 Tax=Cynara cardunculus var. scolymus TaxID=59895 RepID=A0A124SGJ0_CYNCS|nr:hypothetical protein Ccrd_015099 [Cynara cardunculus var. scolymus]
MRKNCTCLKLLAKEDKMHHLSCKQLEKIIDKITSIFTAIESARPRGESGILALCSLHQCMEKCKLLLHHCSESSKLYLVYINVS